MHLLYGQHILPETGDANARPTTWRTKQLYPCMLWIGRCNVSKYEYKSQIYKVRLIQHVEGRVCV